MNDLNFPALGGGNVWGGRGGAAGGGTSKVAFSTLASEWQRQDDVAAERQRREKVAAEREEFERRMFAKTAIRHTTYDRGSRWEEEEYDDSYGGGESGEEGEWDRQRMAYAGEDRDREWGGEEQVDLAKEHTHYHMQKNFGACGGGECGGHVDLEEDDDGWTVVKKKPVRTGPKPRVFVAADVDDRGEEDEDEHDPGNDGNHRNRDSIW